MQAVIFTGIQGAGKSTYYQRRFATSHLRVSMDLAGSRARERRLVEGCIARRTPFVVDNTNATIAARKPYIDLAKAAGYRVISYFFPPDINLSLERNAARTGKAKIPVPGIYRTLKHLEPPTRAEGFDAIYEVRPAGEDFSERRIS